MRSSELEDVLLKYRNAQFLVIEPGGNNGDKLIYMGMEKRLKELGIKYTVLQYKENIKSVFLHKLYFTLWRKLFGLTKFLAKLNNSLETSIRIIDRKLFEFTIVTSEIQSSADIILIHGGSNINDLWGHGIRLLKNVLKNNPNKIVIVAPQTFWFRETCFPNLLKKVTQEVYLFCRERRSYRLLNSMNFSQNVHVCLSQDTALYLSREDFDPKDGEYDLVCLRKDQESVISADAELMENFQRAVVKGLRLSKRALITVDLALLPNFDDFVSLLEDSRKVYTDRLHVAMMAAIIGKDVTLYSNSYFKSREIFVFSLDAKYPNVKFVDVGKSFEIL